MTLEMAAADTKIIISLRQRIAELEKALAPFAALSPLVTGKDDSPWCGQPPVVIRHADIRRAGAMLGGPAWAGSDDDAALIAEASKRAIAITLSDKVSCTLLQRLAGALSAHGVPPSQGEEKP